MIDKKLVERLREACPSARDYTEETHNKLLLHEAADEIERLYGGRDTMGNLWAKAKEENERLRAALEMVIDNVETGSYESTGQAIDRARDLLAGKVRKV